MRVIKCHGTVVLFKRIIAHTADSMSIGLGYGRNAPLPEFPSRNAPTA